jgi:hypothetical protein
MNQNQPEIQEIDLKNLDKNQEELIQKLLQIVARHSISELEAIECDKDQQMFGCICGVCQPMISTNQLIDEIKKLSHRGLDDMIDHVKVMILMEQLRHEQNKKSWRYKWRKFVKSLRKK